MKKNLHSFKSYFLLLVSGLLLNFGIAKAQVVTLVAPGENTITDAVNAAGDNDTLVLARGEEYTLTEPASINKPLTIRSQPGLASEKPAVIYFTSTTGEGGGLFNCGANCNFVDLGLTGKTTEDKPVLSFNFTVPKIKVVADRCIFQDNHELFNSGADASITIKNCVMFNFTWSLYDGWVGQMGGWDSDSIHLELKNNTIFAFSRYFNYSTTKYGGTTVADHNTIVNTFNNTVFPSPDKELVITNNIFVNTFYRGYVGDRVFYAGTDSAMTTSDASSNELANRPYIPETDTLNGDISIIASPLDTTHERVVRITNNMKYTDMTVKGFHASNGVTTEPLINETEKNVIAAQLGWTISNNLDGEQGFNPQFAMGAIPEAAFTRGFQARLDRISPENNSWFDLAYRPDGATVGEFQWPLPFDFTPSVPTTQYSSDGYPLGNLNWYGKDVVARYEAGLPYIGVGIKNQISADLGMNIFGDKISYEISQTSNVSLKIYNIAGIEVSNLVNQVQNTGKQTVSIPESLSNGLYILKLQVGSSMQTKKAVIAK